MRKRYINPVKKTEELKDLYKTCDSFKLCKYLNIKVMFEELGNVIGFCQIVEGIKIIHINSKIPQKKKITVCAHELGHALLHHNLKKIFLDNNNYLKQHGNIGMEANLFMIELLLVNGKIKNKYICTGTALEIIEKFINIPGQKNDIKYSKNILEGHIEDRISENTLDNCIDDVKKKCIKNKYTENKINRNVKYKILDDD